MDEPISPSASGSGEGPSSSTPTIGGGCAAGGNGCGGGGSSSAKDPPPPPPQLLPPSRYESQKRRDWNTFLQYLKNHKPPLSLSRSNGTHVIDFLKYLDQFGKTKVHSAGCAYFGHPTPPASCTCPLRQAWGSLDALIGRLRAAYDENGGKPESNPFGARTVRIFLREVKDSQAKARGKPYEKKKRKRLPPQPSSAAAAAAAAASIPTTSDAAGAELSLSSTSTASASATANSSSAIIEAEAVAAAAATDGAIVSGGGGGGATRPEGSVPLPSGSSAS